MRDLIGSRSPFLIFFLDHVLEADAVHTVLCELRRVFLLRSEALSLSPEVSQELWLKPPWKYWRKLKGKAETHSGYWFVRATHFLATLILVWTYPQGLRWDTTGTPRCIVPPFVVLYWYCVFYKLKVCGNPESRKSITSLSAWFFQQAQMMVSNF